MIDRQDAAVCAALHAAHDAVLLVLGLVDHAVVPQLLSRGVVGRFLPASAVALPAVTTDDASGPAVTAAIDHLAAAVPSMTVALRKGDETHSVAILDALRRHGRSLSSLTVMFELFAVPADAAPLHAAIASALAALAAADLPALKTLQFRGEDQNHCFPAVVADAVCAFSGLDELALTCATFEPSVLATLAAQLPRRSPNLTALTFAQCTVECASLVNALPSLTRLNFYDTPLNEDTVAAMGSHPALVSVCANSWQAPLDDITRSATIRSMTLEANDDASIPVICRMPLTALDLSHCEEMSDGAAICALEIPTLTTLVFPACWDGRPRQVAKSLMRCQSLRALCLPGCEDFVAEAGSAIARMSGLTALDLSDCETVDAEFLATAAAHLHHLRFLGVRGCDVDAECIEALAPFHRRGNGRTVRSRSPDDRPCGVSRDSCVRPTGGDAASESFPQDVALRDLDLAFAKAGTIRAVALHLPFLTKLNIGGNSGDATPSAADVEPLVSLRHLTFLRLPAHVAVADVHVDLRGVAVEYDADNDGSDEPYLDQLAVHFDR